MVGPIRFLVSALATGALVLGAVPGARAARAGDFGAIAVDPATGAHGTSALARTRAAAEQAAVRRCRRRGCRVLIWVRAQCAAAVVTRSAFWAGWGATASRALALARLRAGDRRAPLVARTCG